VAELAVGVAVAELAKVLPGVAARQVPGEEPLDRARHLRRRHTVADRAGGGLVLPDRPAHAEVVGVDQLAVQLELFPLDPDVGDPVLAAAVRAAGHVKLHVLVEPREPALQSSTSQRAKPLVSVRASLQNSVPVQATVPRQNGEASSRRSAEVNLQIGHTTLDV
jgi:hypothetical protein